MGSRNFKKPPSKADLREDLSQAVDRFLSKGGSIQRVAQGETALEGRQNPLRTPLFSEPPAHRTPVNDVIETLDQRRKALLKRTPTRKRGRKPRPRKRVIYDDFGEALRTVWVED